MSTNSRLASAIHIMSFVAYSGDEGTTSEAIAKSLKTNPVVVRKILRLLDREGLVTLRQGRHGGVGLRLPASDITLRQMPGVGDRRRRGGLGEERSEEHTSELQSHKDLACHLQL